MLVVVSVARASTRHEGASSFGGLDEGIMGAFFGTLLLIGAVWWVIVAIRSLPGTTHTTSEINPGTTFENELPHFLLAVVLAVAFLVGGLALLF